MSSLCELNLRLKFRYFAGLKQRFYNEEKLTPFLVLYYMAL